MIPPATWLLAVGLLSGLLYGEYSRQPYLALVFKSVLSMLFVAAGVYYLVPVGTYGIFMLAGLCACLMGDICLALPSKKMFSWGLVAFLIGHIAYIGGFSLLTTFNVSMIVAGLAVGLVTTSIYWVLRNFLGNMKRAVIAYMAAISLMVALAAGLFGTRHLPENGRSLVLAGAVLFYLSDLFVAMDRFVRQAWHNRLIGLPLYYTGQFLLAFSIGSLK